MKKLTIGAITTTLGFLGLVVSPTSASAAAVPDCVKNGDTLTCVGVYEGGAHGVQFVRVKNPYNFGVYMRTTDGPTNVCVESGGYLYVDPATRMAGIIVVSAGTWVPGTPVPC